MNNTYLTSAAAPNFNETLRAQGLHLMRRRTIRFKVTLPHEAAATVREGLNHQVNLARYEQTLFADCDCVTFERDGACAHVWAVLLEAERRWTLRGDDGAEELLYVKWEGRTAAGKKRTLNLANVKADPPKPRADAWKKQLKEIKPANVVSYALEPWPASRQLLYVIDVATTLQGKGLYLEVLTRDRKKNGEWARPKNQRLQREVLAHLADPEDRFALSYLQGASAVDTYSYGYAYVHNEATVTTKYRLLAGQPEILLPLLCRTGRCFLRMQPPAHQNQQDYEAWLPLTWDEGEPWQLRVSLERPDDTADGAPDEAYAVRGYLVRGAERLPLTEPVLLADAGIFFTRTQALRCDYGEAYHWVGLLRKHKELTVPAAAAADFLTQVLTQAAPPALELPATLAYETVRLTPRPHLRVKEADKHAWHDRDRLRGELSFAYGDEIIPAHTTQAGVYDAAKRQFFIRDSAAEAEAAALLDELGWQFRPPDYSSGYKPRWVLAPQHLPKVVRQLLAANWHLEAEGKVYRQPGEFKLEVTSGIDWFDLHGEIEFDGVKASLPALLAALRRGEQVVALGDGTFGLLPEEWLQKYGLLAGLGEVEGERLRFKRAQVGLLDALLAAQPEARFDEHFAQARARLNEFSGIQALAQPPGFVGELRGYQKEGLGWLHFLQTFGFGGCLADDMGVGKTPQVLALLEARRALRANGKQNGENGSKPKHGKKPAKPTALPAMPAAPLAVTPATAPSLVVVPKSLVFNWMQEAQRFTPNLRVLDHTGQLRQKEQTEHFADYDVVLTTYGTLRNDAVQFKDVEFDYVVLDEAQAIKNADTASAKATRLLRGQYRLALSGTPIENHLGELWSLFEFLNPGMLGAASVFKLTGAGARNPDEETRQLLAQALRPFILRRTKEQVVKELPAKLEQTLYCELEGTQRKLYNELRDHYRQSLLGRVEMAGLKKSKIQILEALLRLRQAALHPGLLDDKRKKDDSAKLDLLLSQISDVLEGDHKALIFSQFTSMLALVRDRLDKEGIVYEYLDGRTRDRQPRVERFQQDPACKLFLISLKAGGLGLNLTAAEYVFLLDPWWNPAVEMQAIDRAHRIGQARQVFAYRLIARDTVEEKVLQLQNTKRHLADAIISADNSLIRDLGREDLELLLS